MKKILMWLTVSLILVGPAQAQIRDDLAVRAILGEASNQGFDGMLAVASALRNRGTLQGVYGLKAKHVDRQPAKVWEQARKAWTTSATRSTVGKATHWDNVRAFGRPYWVKDMVLVVRIGDHWFYKPKQT